MGRSQGLAPYPRVSSPGFSSEGQRPSTSTTTHDPPRPRVLSHLRHLKPAIRESQTGLQEQASLQTRDVGPRGRRPEHRRSAVARDTRSRSSRAREPRYVNANYPEYLRSSRHQTQPRQVYHFRRSADPFSQQRWCSHRAKSSPPQRHSQQRWCDHHHAQSTQRSIYHSPKLEARLDSAAEVPGLSLHHGPHSHQNGEPRPRVTTSTPGRAVRGPCDSQRGAGGQTQVPKVRGLGPQAQFLARVAN